MLRIGAVTEATEAEGPGRRFAVWSQGCSVRCSGCFNPHLWSADGGELVDPAGLARRAAATDVEGVTLLGGEPFDQAEAFADFAEHAQHLGLSVMTFTGHLLEHLTSTDAPAGAARLVAASDLLVDGPYLADRPDLVRPWVGSTNQRFHVLTERYADLADTFDRTPDRLEVRIAANGELAVNGWAPVSVLDDLLADTTSPVGRGSVR